jgi:hypothetical protein
VIFLTLGFLFHGGVQVGVVLGDGQIAAEHGGPRGSGSRKGGHSNPSGFIWHMKAGHVRDERDARLKPGCKPQASSFKPQAVSFKLNAARLLLVARRLPLAACRC